MLYHMGLCQVDASIFLLWVFTSKKSSRVPSTVTPKFYFSYLSLQRTDPLDLGLQLLSPLYRGCTWLTTCKRHIHISLTFWILAPLGVYWLGTYNRPFYLFFDHRHLCEIWVHIHCCLHLPLGKLLVPLGIVPSQWVPIETIERNPLA